MVRAPLNVIYGAKPHNSEHSLEVYKSEVFSDVCVSKAWVGMHYPQRWMLKHSHNTES